MPADYVVWRWGPGENDAYLDDIMGADDEPYPIGAGTSRAGQFPGGAKLPMSKDFPNNTILSDNPDNTNGFLVVSGRLKEFLEGRGLKAVEFLPVTVVNHKRRPTGKDYFIANPIDPLECLDVAQSGGRISAGLGTIKNVKKLVLIPSRLDPDREMFRIKDLRQVVLASRALAAAIDAAGFTGTRWVELDQYPD